MVVVTTQRAPRSVLSTVALGRYPRVSRQSLDFILVHARSAVLIFPRTGVDDEVGRRKTLAVEGYRWARRVRPVFPITMGEFRLGISDFIPFARTLYPPRIVDADETQ